MSRAVMSSITDDVCYSGLSAIVSPGAAIAELHDEMKAGLRKVMRIGDRGGRERCRHEWRAI